ncbi:MAG: TerB family tellurite resistance protein [Rhodothermales bacterium]|nr:TerB family tellurite resistance protein [Rhodothermales bacterium]MBO6781598.1 TerB family tellurite resistance protein [Rhodothermales bacterium]
MSEKTDPTTSPDNAQDLALIFIALAYGADAELTDREIESLTAALSRWRPEADEERIREIVVEAWAVFEEDEEGDEVVRAIENLNTVLKPASKQRALEDVMRVAEADGLLLTSERSLIAVLAATWDLRGSEAELIANTTATIDSRPVWSILHDIAVLGIAVAHGSTGSLDEVEIDSLSGRLSGWRSELEIDDTREIIRSALEIYSTLELTVILQQSASSIKERLPHALRLIVLDDLIAVAEADGRMNRNEADMIGSLAQAWQLGVRVDA